MLLYKYDETTKEYLGYFEAYIDPLETRIQGKDVYVYPPCTTDKVPPELREGYVSVFNLENNNWEEFEDHRGLVVWNKDGEEILVDTIGAIPNGLFIERPVSCKELKDEKLLEIREAYSKALDEKVKVGEISACIEDAALLRNRVEAFKDFGNITFEDSVLTIEEAEEVIKYLYIRSFLLLEKKNSLVKELLSLKSKEKIKEFKVDFSLDMKEYLDLSIEDLREKFSKEI